MLDVPGMMGCINSCLSSRKASGNSRGQGNQSAPGYVSPGLFLF